MLLASHQVFGDGLDLLWTWTVPMKNCPVPKALIEKRFLEVHLKSKLTHVSGLPDLGILRRGSVPFAVGWPGFLLSFPHRGPPRTCL